MGSELLDPRLNAGEPPPDAADWHDDLPAVDLAAEADHAPEPVAPEGRDGNDSEVPLLEQLGPLGILPRLGAPFTPVEAGQRAASEHAHPTRSWYYDCQLFVRTRYGVGGLYGSASLAYYGTNHRHTSWPPPYGATVWWTGGAGHTAFSLGDGTCWSNDFLRAGHIDRVNIKSITTGWRKPYHGWSEDINEVRVLNPASFVDLSKVVDAAHGHDRVHHGDLLKKAVAAEVGRGGMILSNSVLGTGFRVQYARLQKRWYGRGDGVPGLTSMSRLCRGHGLTLIP